MRQSADETIALRKRATKGLGALGRWAAGGAITAKSPEEELEEAKQNTIKIHRDGVIWFLSRKLEEVSGFQASMMEIRLEREREKSKSVLYKVRGVPMPTIDDPTSGYSGAKGASLDEKAGQQVEQQLSEEQLQLFAEENQDMLKHYEDTLDKVRYVTALSHVPDCEADKVWQGYRAVPPRDIGVAEHAGHQSVRAAGAN